MKKINAPTITTHINNDTHTQQVFSDISEILIDQGLDGLAKDIPVVGTFVNLYKSTQSIRHQIEIKKLTNFFMGFIDFSDEEKVKINSLFDGDLKKQRTLADDILLALDRQDSLEKPLFLFKFFKSFVNGNIDLLTFTRLKQALEKFNLGLAEHLRVFYGEQLGITSTFQGQSEEIWHELSLAGLATVSLNASGTIGGSANYVRNSIGTAFVEIGLKNSSEYSVKHTDLWSG